jgi:ribosomal protein L37AE/L43A
LPDGERLMTVVRRHENVTNPDAAEFCCSECGARKVTRESKEVRRRLEQLQAER